MPNSERIKEIFSGALAKRSLEERESYLAEAYYAHPDLQEEVESLLGAHEQAGEFLSKTMPPTTSASTREVSGAIIARYKLLELIGEGGFGSVWMAEQEEPVRRRVALKVIKPGMDTKQVLARFEAERQALAMMDHPCIARVFDGGATDAGRPYFVMELVRGVRITEYCDANSLSMRERLGLFVQVCQAVQHAHQKGIIHRDLKPSNILVTEVDGAPVPKVIDFGVAKATQARLTELTLFTALHQVIGTPAYMSPEQAGLGALDMDTRTDIYALGVLLYELLTGQTPLTKKDFETAGMDEIFRLIREREPPRPSTRLKSLTRAELTTIAARRRVEPLKLNRLLNGDLDWIVMKCLEKNRNRRYDSASSLAMDIRRHLENQPVAASPPSLLYQFQKLVRRRKAAFAASMAVFMAALAGALYWWFLPGALNVEVAPADTQVNIDGREYPTGAMRQPIKLSSGPHQVKFHKAEFSSEIRSAVVPRGGFVNIPHLVLRHEQGILDVQSSPAGMGIQFEGVDYYSAINERATDTGTHELIGFGEGFFEKRRAITIKHNERRAEKISLENGVSWKYPSPGIQRSFFIFTNTYPGQPAVIADVETSKIVFLSSADGSPIGSMAMPSGNITTVVQLDLGADVGPVVISGIEEAGVGLTLNAFTSSWPTNFLWTWGGPSAFHGPLGGIAIATVPRPGSVSSVAFAGRDGHVRVVNGRTGELEQDFVVFTHTPMPPSLASWSRDGRTYLLALLSSPGTNVSRTNEMLLQGVLTDVATGVILWQKDLGAAQERLLAELDQSGAPWILLSDSSRWRLFDPLTGELKCSKALPGRIRVPMSLVHAEEKGEKNLLLQFADPSLPMLAVRPADGATVWQGPTNLALHVGHDDGPFQQIVEGPLLVALENSLLALDAASGRLLWELKAKPYNWLIEGQTGNIYLTLTDHRLLCLNSGGGTNWTLRLGEDSEQIVPMALVPAIQGGGQRDLLLARERGLLEMVHWPRLLWDAKATGGLQATPLVVKDTNGQPVIVQLGAWGGEANMVGLDGATGRIIWSNSEYIAPNRAPALASFEGDGNVEIGAIGWHIRGTDLRLIIRLAADGSMVRDPLVSLTGWMTGGVAADFRGLGRNDMAVSAYDDKNIILIDGRTGTLLWQQPTEKENMGGLAAADIDGDGLPDVLATSLDGHVYALRGTDGKLLWKTASNEYPSGSPPTVADLNGDGKPQVLITTVQGQLFVFNGADGSLLWSPDSVGNMEISGRATVASHNGRKLILAPMGSNGVVAFDWSTRTELWRSPQGYPIMATPVVADLAHDGRQQVVVGTTNGYVFVLDLADGKSLWRLKVAQDKIEADPVVAHLNNDEWDDILIASYDFHLYAINGRYLIPALGHNQISSGTPRPEISPKTFAH